MALHSTLPSTPCLLSSRTSLPHPSYLRHYTSNTSSSSRSSRPSTDTSCHPPGIHTGLQGNLKDEGKMFIFLCLQFLLWSYSYFVVHEDLWGQFCSDIVFRNICIIRYLFPRILSNDLVICLSRRTPERVPHQPHRLRPGYEFAPPLHVPPQPVVQQPRYLAEGTDW